MDNTKRHAYLIAVHKNQKQIENLLSLLDIEENDLYIHVDLKSTEVDMEALKAVVKKAGIFFVRRVSVLWGHITIVESTLIMLEAAVKNGPYSCYHLISGQDMPLMTAREINRFYDEEDQGINHVELCDEDWIETHARARIDYYKFSQDPKTVAQKINNFFRRCIRFVKKKTRTYAGGAAWFDIRHDLALKLLKNRDWIYKNTSNDLLPDESALQRVIVNLKLQDSCGPLMRYIDWNTVVEGRYPYVFCIQDFDRLISSGMHFARKFDVDIDAEIIEKISAYLREKEGTER
ncbi:MAG: hypothetical protein K6E50_15365 [Lachnospiraceae bacterium]|nr:hypothetical protein [Lachnospiraceae bacterium]